MRQTQDQQQVQHKDPDDHVEEHWRVRLQPRDVVSLVAVGAALGTAVGYLIADHTSLGIAARVLASDTIVLLPGLWFAIIVTRRLTIVARRLARLEVVLSDQLDAELAGYNRGYLDHLKHG